MGQFRNNVQSAINGVCLQVLKGYTVTEFKDLFLHRNSGRRRNENIILPIPETNFIRNSICFRGAIAWNSLTNEETRAKILKEFKRCLAKFDTDKMTFEPILATTKNREISVTNTFNSFNFQLYICTTYFSRN